MSSITFNTEITSSLIPILTLIMSGDSLLNFNGQPVQEVDLTPYTTFTGCDENGCGSSWLQPSCNGCDGWGQQNCNYTTSQPTYNQNGITLNAYNVPDNMFYYLPSTSPNSDIDSGFTGVSCSSNYSQVICGLYCHGKGLCGVFNACLTTQLAANICADCFIYNTNNSSDSPDNILYNQFNFDTNHSGTQQNGGYTVTDDLSKPNKGTVQARYHCTLFDNGGGISDQITDFSTIQQYIKSIATGKINGISNLPQESIWYMRDTMFLYSLTSTFYNRIYQFGLYTPPLTNISNDFLQVNILSTNLNTYKQTFINDIFNSIFNTYYPNNLIPTDLKNIINNNALVLPTIQQKGDDYYLNVYLNYDQMTSYFNKPDILLGLINNFFQDNLGEIIINQKGSPFTEPIFQEIVNIGYNYIKIAMNTGSSTINYFSQVNPTLQPISQGISSNSTYIFFLNYQIQVKIQNWSIMTLAYATSQQGISFSDNAAQLSYRDTGAVPLQYIDLKPNLLPNFINCCETSINYTNNDVYISIENSLLISSSKQCLCYNGLTAPPSVQKPGNRIAMCFDKYCDPTQRQLFNLTDAECSKYCNTAYGWFNSTENDMQPSNPSDIDWNAFNRICGSDYKPTIPTKYNRNVIIIGSIFTILLTVISFLLCKYFGLGNFYFFIICFLVFIISAGLTSYFSLYLSGMGTCGGNNNKTYECLSQLTKTSIPQEFCNDFYNCECEFDQDCPTGYVCSTTTCRPNGGTRPTHIENVNNPNYNIWILLSVIIISILFFGISSFLYIDYQWSINKNIYYISTIIISMIPIIYVFIKHNQKIQKTVYNPLP